MDTRSNPARMCAEVFRALLPQEQVEALHLINEMRAEATDEPARIRRALASTGDHIGRAAELLGYSRRRLQYRMRELDIAPGKPGRKRQ